MVFDRADGRLLANIKGDDPPFGCLLPLNADVIEVAGVPNRAKVAFQRGLVIDIARASIDPPRVADLERNLQRQNRRGLRRMSS